MLVKRDSSTNLTPMNCDSLPQNTWKLETVSLAASHIEMTLSGPLLSFCRRARGGSRGAV